MGERVQKIRDSIANRRDEVISKVAAGDDAHPTRIIESAEVSPTFHIEPDSNLANIIHERVAKIRPRQN